MTAWAPVISVAPNPNPKYLSLGIVTVALVFVCPTSTFHDTPAPVSVAKFASEPLVNTVSLSVGSNKVKALNVP